MHDVVIETKNLTKAYNGVKVLDSLTMNVKKGEVLGYLGPNGAGKTTTLRLLLGLIHPTSGSAHILGYDTQTQKLETHAHLAYVPGDTSLWPNLSGGETLDLLGNLHGTYDKAYRTELVKRFDLDEKKKIRAYSKANRQKVSLIAGLMTRAEILILDEPTSGLDPLMEQLFRDCIAEAKANGQTVLLSSHILGEVEALCDRIAILRKGILIETGTMDELRKLKAYQIKASFHGTPPKVDHLAGVSAVVVKGSQLSCHVVGDMQPLLEVITKAKPETFISTEPSLEELFLSLYGEER
jgi:ABC-2 type transport system ATP-binding protein